MKFKYLFLVGALFSFSVLCAGCPCKKKEVKKHLPKKEEIKKVVKKVVK